MIPLCSLQERDSRYPVFGDTPVIPDAASAVVPLVDGDGTAADVPRNRLPGAPGVPRGGPAVPGRPGLGASETTVGLHPGGVLVCFTDGISERHDGSGAFFDDSRGADVLRWTAPPTRRPPPSSPRPASSSPPRRSTTWPCSRCGCCRRVIDTATPVKNPSGMSEQTAGLLRERASQLRVVHQDLAGKGPLQPALVLAQQPDVWTGRLRDAFVAYLQRMDGFLRSRVAPSVDVLAGWLERRAGEIEQHQYAASVGAADVALPPPPALLSAPGPGSPGSYTLEIGSATGFVGVDPARLRDVAMFVGRAADEVYDHGARLNRIVSELVGVGPPDAHEAAGIGALAQVSGLLKTAAGDLHRRAKDVEDAERRSDRVFGGAERTATYLKVSVEQLPWAAEKAKALGKGEKVFDTSKWIRKAKNPTASLRRDLRAIAKAKTPESSLRFAGKAGTRILAGVELMFKGKEEWDRRDDLGTAERLLHASWTGVTEGGGSAWGAILGAQAGTLAASLLIVGTGPLGIAVAVGLGLVGAAIGGKIGELAGGAAGTLGKGFGRGLARGAKLGGKLVAGGVKAVGKIFGFGR